VRGLYRVSLALYGDENDIYQEGGGSKAKIAAQAREKQRSVFELAPEERHCLAIQARIAFFLGKTANVALG
jgi:hypothetical protein